MAELRSQLTKEEQTGVITQSSFKSVTQSISGLGGICKTQTAVEYAYRYRDPYTAVLWFHAETLGELKTGFVEMPHDLALPEKGAPDPRDPVLAFLYPDQGRYRDTKLSFRHSLASRP